MHARTSHPVNSGIRISNIGLIGLPLSDRDADAFCGVSACAAIKPCGFQITNPEFKNFINYVTQQDLAGLGVAQTAVRVIPYSLQLETRTAIYRIPYLEE